MHYITRHQWIEYTWRSCVSIEIEWRNNIKYKHKIYCNMNNSKKKKNVNLPCKLASFISIKQCKLYYLNVHTNIPNVIIYRNSHGAYWMDLSIFSQNKNNFLSSKSCFFICLLRNQNMIYLISFSILYFTFTVSQKSDYDFFSKGGAFQTNCCN